MPFKWSLFFPLNCNNCPISLYVFIPYFVLELRNPLIAGWVFQHWLERRSPDPCCMAENLISPSHLLFQLSQLKKKITLYIQTGTRSQHFHQRWTTFVATRTMKSWFVTGDVIELCVEHNLMIVKWLKMPKKCVFYNMYG